MLDHAELMSHAINAAKQGIEAGQSPFGAVIATSGGEIIQVAHNTVRSGCDPTAHAEVVAIRKAATELGCVDLKSHVLATTCEPCPMCAAAIHWARLDAVIYGADIADAQWAGFNELAVSIESLYTRGPSTVRLFPHVLRDECRDLFERWKAGPNPQPY